MISALNYLWKQLTDHIGLFVILFVMVILRLPNFLEPYWYGDEAIYLTLGNAINQGSLLYTDIVDHKTPLIYQLARVPDQYSFRLLLLAWMIITLALFYCFSRRLLGKKYLAIISTGFLMVFTTLPLFEGNIPNGELFVMGFVMMGAFILRHTRIFSVATTIQPHVTHGNQITSTELLQKLGNIGKGFAQESLLLLITGAFFGLAILTKVPALLDVAAFMAIFWFIFANTLLNVNKQTVFKILPILITRLAMLLVGIGIPIIASMVYYKMLGSGNDYLNFGLLYNFHYTGTWKLQFNNPTLTWLFTFGAKTLLLFAGLVLTTLLGKKIPFKLQFAFSWFLLAIFATLLSNRPYPHYFIQIFPALGLLLALMVESIEVIASWLNKHSKLNRLAVRLTLPQIILSLFAVMLSISIMYALHVGLYPVAKYYANSWLYSQNQMSEKAYFSSFDGLVNENYEVAEVITQMQLKDLFIWGTNPMIYAQTKTVPTSRFTVAFHIKDVNNFEQTLQKIKLEKPRMIIVMRGEENSFPELNRYLTRNYLVNYQYRSMTVYIRRLEASTLQAVKR